MTASDPTSSAAGNTADIQHGVAATPGEPLCDMACGAFATTAATGPEPVEVDFEGHVLYSAAYSHYARRILLARPELPAIVAAAAAQPLTQSWMSERLKALREPSADMEESVKRALRRLRAEVMCVVIEA
ncbi:hypothetical protein ACTMU2_08735 [Cupriavidus basilensis]